MILRICILSVILFFVASVAYASPVAVLDEKGVKVTLYDEPCKFTHVVSLPYRATWEQDGKKFEGCFNVHQQAGAVVAYFDDKSIALMPTSLFRPMRSM